MVILTNQPRPKSGRSNSCVVAAIALMCLVVLGCEGDSDLSRPEIDRLLQRLVGASLPLNATDVHGRTLTVMNAIADFRFTCTKSELKAFLTQSPHLPDTLAMGVELPNKTSPIDWWRPNDLRNTFGFRGTHPENDSTVYVDLVTGNLGPSELATVYLSITVE